MSNPQSPEELVFWVAYQPNGELKNYLGDGQGHIRLFKSEQALRDFITPLLTPEELAKTIIHPVNGNFVVPEPEEKKPLPIHTLALQTMPTAMELLNNYKKRRRSK